MTTTEMDPDGSPRDCIIVSIADDQVEIVGLPVEAATGQAEMTVKRGG